MTVYYMQDALYDTAQKDKVKAFQPVSCQTNDLNPKPFVFRY
jgi:hypothetical protein